MFTFSHKQLCSFGFAVTILFGNTFCAQHAPVQGTVGDQVKNAVDAAKDALGEISKISFKGTVQQPGQQTDQYTLSEQAQQCAVKIANLSEPLRTMVANVFAAKVVAYFIREFNTEFLNKQDMLQGVGSKQALVNLLVQKIGKGLNRLNNNDDTMLTEGNWKKDVCKVTLQHDRVFIFTLEQIDLDRLIEAVAGVLYTAGNFISDLKKSMQDVDHASLAEMFNRMEVNYEVNGQQQKGSIKQYIDDIANMLDEKIQETLILCVKKAKDAINQHKEVEKALQKDIKQTLQLGNEFKGKAIAVFGNVVVQANGNQVSGITKLRFM